MDGLRIVAAGLLLWQGVMGRMLFLACSLAAFGLFAAAASALYAACSVPWSWEDSLGTAMLGPFGMMLVRSNVPEEFPLALPFFYMVFRISVKRLRDLEWDEILAWLILVPAANFVLWPILLAAPGWRGWGPNNADRPICGGLLKSAVPKSGPAAGALVLFAACAMAWAAVRLGLEDPWRAWEYVLLAHLLSGLLGPIVLGLHRSRPFLDCFAIGFWLSLAVMACVLGFGADLPVDAQAMATAGILVGWAGACIGYGIQMRPRRHVGLERGLLPPPRFEA